MYVESSQTDLKSNQNSTGMLKYSYPSKHHFCGKYYFPVKATWWAQKMSIRQKFFLGKKLFYFRYPKA